MLFTPKVAGEDDRSEHCFILKTCRRRFGSIHLSAQLPFVEYPFVIQFLHESFLVERENGV